MSECQRCLMRSLAAVFSGGLFNISSMVCSRCRAAPSSLLRLCSRRCMRNCSVSRSAIVARRSIRLVWRSIRCSKSWMRDCRASRSTGLRRAGFLALSFSTGGRWLRGVLFFLVGLVLSRGASAADGSGSVTAAVRRGLAPPASRVNSSNLNGGYPILCIFMYPSTIYTIYTIYMSDSGASGLQAAETHGVIRPMSVKGVHFPLVFPVDTVR